MFDFKYFLSLSLPFAVLVIYTVTLQQYPRFVVVSRSVSSNPPRNPLNAVSQNKISTDELASKYDLFLLQEWCSARCEADVARKLETRFRCTEVVVLPVLRSVQARCRLLRSMTPRQVEKNVVQKITGMKGYVNNLKLPLSTTGERVYARDLSTLPPRQAKQSSFVYRLVQSITGMLPWGLDRIDQTSGKDGKFDLSCFPNLGKGVTVYVLDTGCRDTHDDLKGRITTEKVGRYESAKDDHGHGTHVAGTAAGTNYGVCKGCDIVCIKTLDENNEGTIVDVVDAVEFVLEQKNANPDIPAVAVMSLGGPLETNILDIAVDKLAEAGVFPAISAGNGFTDACEWTPPRAQHAVTVGATMENDELRFSSNYGKCVKIVAPGEEIRAASHEGDSLYVTMSGTSMAAPYVAGVAGLILGEDGRLTPAQVLEKMVIKAKIVDDVFHGSEYPLLRVLHDNCELYGFNDSKSLPSTPSPSISATPSSSASASLTASTSPTPSSSPSTLPSPYASFSPSMSTSPTSSSSVPPTPSSSMSPTPSASTSPTPFPSASFSPSISTSPTPSSSLYLYYTPTASVSRSPAPSLSASFMPLSYASASPSTSTSPTPSSTMSPIPSASSSSTLSPSASLMPLSFVSASPSTSTSPTPSLSTPPTPSSSSSSMPSSFVSASPSTSTSPTPSSSSSSTPSLSASLMPLSFVSASPSTSTSPTPSLSTPPTPSSSSSSSSTPSLSASSMPASFVSASPSTSTSPTHSLLTSPTPSTSSSSTPSISASFMPLSYASASPSTSTSPTPSLSKSATPSVSPSPTPSLGSFMPFSSISFSPSTSSSPMPSLSASPMGTGTPSAVASTLPARSSSSTHSPSVSFTRSPSVPVSHQPTPSRKPVRGNIGPFASASPCRFVSEAIS